MPNCNVFLASAVIDEMMKGLKYYIILVSLALCFATLSCKKDKSGSYMSNGEIIGFDEKECPCCGGTEIIIDNYPNPNGNPYFLIGEIPPGFQLGDHPTFPIAVKLDWTTDTAHCFGNYINISRIDRR